MAALFFRDGRAFTGTASDADTKPYTMVRAACGRCGGAGGADKWAHTGWTCFDCNGSGVGSAKMARLYTAERLAKLDASLNQRRAVKSAAAALAQQAQQAEVAARRETFRAQHALLLAWLEEVALEPDTEERVYRDGFLGEMLARADRYAMWSEKQAEAVQTAYDRMRQRTLKRAASRPVGEIGQRIEATVTVEHEASFMRAGFMRSSFGSDNYEVVYITTLRDADGNALIVKSANFRVPVGETITVRGTVKSHDEYRGEAQTTLQRVKQV